MKEPEEKNAIDTDKHWDKAHKWDATKLRVTVKCDDGEALRCIYSKFAVGLKNDPTLAEEEIMEQILDKGYVCGFEIKGIGKFSLSLR